MLKRTIIATSAIVLAATVAAAADDQHDDHRTVVHKTVVDKTVVRPAATRGWAARSDFRQGGHVAQNDWRNGRVIDYRTNRNLRAPPPGYEWREVNGQYILAAVATGLIASIIMSQ
jgi:Ni/Co efflux regulator RcnB